MFNTLHSSKTVYSVGKSGISWGNYIRPETELEGGDEEHDIETGELIDVTPLRLKYNMKDGANGGSINVNLDLFKELKEEGSISSVKEEVMSTFAEEFSGAMLHDYYGKKTGGYFDQQPNAANFELETQLMSGVIKNQAGIPISLGNHGETERFGIDYVRGKKGVNDYFNLLKSWQSNPNTSPRYRRLKSNDHTPDYITNEMK